MHFGIGGQVPCCLSVDFAMIAVYALMIVVSVFLYEKSKFVRIVYLQIKDRIFSVKIVYFRPGSYFFSYDRTGGRGEKKQKSAVSSRPTSVQRAFFFLQAKADNFEDIKYIAKRKVKLNSILTFLKDHSQASPSPVGFIFAPFSLFFVVKPRKSLVICRILIILFFLFHTS